MIGIWQLVLIIFVIILLFGANRIPNLMKDLARGIKVFKEEMGSGSKDLKK